MEASSITTPALVFLLCILLSNAAADKSFLRESRRKASFHVHHLTKSSDPFLDNDLFHDSNNPLDDFSDAMPPNPAPARALAPSPAPMPAQALVGEKTTIPAKKGLNDTSAMQLAHTHGGRAGPAKKTASKNGTVAATTPAANEMASNETLATKKPAEKLGAKEASAELTRTPGPSQKLDCVTRKDSRIAAWFAQTAAEGTPCVFGVDVNDEGSHCIFDGGEYGSNGWCYTDAKGMGWGSCGDACPLSGPPESLDRKLRGVAETVGKIVTKLRKSKGADTSKMTKLVQALPSVTA